MRRSYLYQTDPGQGAISEYRGMSGFGRKHLWSMVLPRVLRNLYFREQQDAWLNQQGWRTIDPNHWRSADVTRGIAQWSTNASR